jgi:hypothetical protein
MRLPSPTLALLAAASALAFVPPAHAHRTINLRVPKFVVPPRSDREVCTFVPLPSKKAFNIAESDIVNIGVKSDFVSHHFLLWSYDGTDLSKFPAVGQVVDSKACLDFGPSDTNNRTLISGAQTPTLKTRLPLGLAQQITPTTSSGKPVIGFILNSHWINSSDKPQKAAVKVRLVAAKPHTIRQYLQPIFEVVANGFIKVPPHAVHEEAWTWEPGGPDLGKLFGGGVVPAGPACVISISSHMHKRGVHFTVDYMQGPTAMERVLDTTTYSDPPQVSFPNQPFMSLLVNPGQALKYTCTHDNGMTTAVKLGCEETVGKAPGLTPLEGGGLKTSGAAKRCSAVGPDPTECPATDPAAYPGRSFTGNCVEANLVFGFTSDDDMCILPGSFYPANAQGNCDLSGLPLLN